MTLAERYKEFYHSNARHHGSITFHHLHCCGLKELHGIMSFGNPWHILFSLRQTVHPGCATWIFSQADNGRGVTIGHDLAELIHELELGTVFVMPPVKNPNSGNMVTMFAWQIDLKKWTDFARKAQKL